MTNPRRWDRIRAIFEEACERQGAERDAFLEEACAGDRALLGEVRELLDGDAQMHSRIGRTVRDAAGTVERSAFVGRLVGPWRLVRELGHGGMGTVYLAERADGQFQQRAALKLIRRGMDSEQILGRFRMERQILARLQHPNIARLLDGGLTDDGQPYFAMEHVEGEPIDRYCDRRRLTVDERLSLFLEACRAVTYAHANLVVHRDLKPDNILVTADGQPRLLDFGVAKLLADDEDLATLTKTGLRVMTPAYASPEQVLARPVGTATDVYSLGVILYELLAGVRPYEIDSRSLSEMERIVCETDPERPSTRVARTTGGSPDLAAQIERSRRTELRRLRKRLVGDLDVICLEALQKEPERRYGSVEALAEDVRRHLDGLPVLARPDTLGYRVRKTIRRHRVAVAAAVAVLMSVSGLTGWYLARLANERDRARVEATKAGEVAAFLVDIFEVADPSETRGAEITAREILEQGAARISVELAGQPEARAALMDAMGRVYMKLGLYAPAGVMLDSALELRRTALGAEHPDVASSVHTLGALQAMVGRYDSARVLYRQALAMQRRLLPSRDPALARTLSDLATLESDAGDYDAAEPLYREAIAIDSVAEAVDETILASDYIDLGSVLRRKGDYDGAEPLLRQGLAMRRRLLGNDHLDVGHALNQLARLLILRRDYEAAEPIAREGLAIRRKIYGPDHIEAAASLGNLAEVQRGLGDLEGAAASRRGVLRITRGLFGERHPYIAAALNSLAGVQLDMGALDSAEANYRASVAMHRALLAPTNPNLGFPLTGLGRTLAAQGRCETALPFLTEATAVRTGGLPEGHPFIAASQGSEGECLIELGRFADAEPLLLASYGTFHTQFGDEDPRTVEARDRLVGLYRHWGRPDRASEVLGTTGR